MILLLRLLSDQNNAIGFTAYTNMDLGLSQNQVVVFNTVPFNIGDDYDATTGVFTCPVNGIYFFGVSAYSSSDRYVSLQLVKDNVAYTGSFGDVEVSKTTDARHVFTISRLHM